MERHDTELIAAFAAVLRQRRKAAGLSQEELAFRAGLSTSYLSLLETRNRQPTLSVMAALCRELGIGVSELMAEVEGTKRRTRTG